MIRIFWRSVRFGIAERLSKRPEGPKYSGLSGLGAFLFVSRGDALRSCPGLSHCAPLALRFIRAGAFGVGAPEAAGGDVSVGDFIDDEVVGG